jgi:hypothetical protein
MNVNINFTYLENLYVGMKVSGRKQDGFPLGRGNAGGLFMVGSVNPSFYRPTVAIPCR